MDEAQLEGRFGTFGDSANLDARSVHGLRRMFLGSKIVLDAPDGNPRCRGSCGISFGPFGDGVSVDVR